MTNKSKHIFTFLLLGCIFIECQSEEQKEANELQPVTLENELTISADLEEALVGNFTGLATGADGSIYVVDFKQQKIHVFSADGAYQDSIGRKGNGPGEFSNLGSRIHIQGDTLYGFQGRQRQADLFNVNSGEYIRSISIPEAEIDGVSLGNPEAIFPQADGSFLVYLMDPYFFAPEEDAEPKYTTIARMDASGSFINKKLLQFSSLYPSQNRLVLREEGIHVYIVNIYPAYAIAAGPDGSFYHAKSDSLRFTKYDNGGNQMDVLESDYQRVPYTAADMDTMVAQYGDRLRKAIANAGIPDYWPSFTKMLMDDEGRLWVQLHKPNEDTQPWWIFDNEGKPAWKFSLPTEVDLYEISEGKAYGIERNEEALPAIHRYDVQF